jgi:hypothetical protein
MNSLDDDERAIVATVRDFVYRDAPGRAGT